jgi:hypothetical protein
VQDGDTIEKEGLRKYRASFHPGKGTNRLTQRVWPKLPLTLEGNKTLKAGGRILDVEDSIVSLHVYNPLAPQRLIYIVTPMARYTSRDILTELMKADP